MNFSFSPFRQLFRNNEVDQGKIAVLKITQEIKNQQKNNFRSTRWQLIQSIIKITNKWAKSMLKYGTEAWTINKFVVNEMKFLITADCTCLVKMRKTDIPEELKIDSVFRLNLKLQK